MIFENDRVSIYHHPTRSANGGVIKYSDKKSGFYIEGEFLSALLGAMIDSGYKIKVIGNVHEGVKE